MERDLKLSANFHVKPEKLYEDWLSSSVHSAFIGTSAVVDPQIGGRFSAWDGYIWGTTLELEQGKRIVQSWRTTEFPEDAPDSRIEIVFEPVGEGTRMTLRHSGIPEGQADDYEQGWIDFYINPMKEHYK